MKIKKKIIIITIVIFAVLLLLIISYLLYSKLNNYSKNDDKKIITCMKSLTDDEYAYDTHYIKIYEYEVKSDKIISTTDIGFFEAEEDQLEELLYLIKGELNVFKTMNGVYVESFKVSNNNVTFILKTNEENINEKELKEKLKNNKLFQYDDEIKNNTMSESLRVHKNEWDICE